jgi:hypothetical protein
MHSGAAKELELYGDVIISFQDFFPIETELDSLLTCSESATV